MLAGGRKQIAQYVLSVFASITASVIVAILPTWWTILGCICTTAAMLTVLVRGLIISPRFWSWLRRTEFVLPLPWEPFCKRAASDDTEIAVSAMDEAIEFIRDEPDLCLDTLNNLHRIARPDANPSIQVREKYARLRLVTMGLMVDSRPELVGALLSTLRDLFVNKMGHVQESAATELGDLCDRVNDRRFNIPRVWRNLCLDFLDKTLVQLLASGPAAAARTLIPRVGAAASDPPRCREMLHHVVSGVFDNEGRCDEQYAEPLCDLVCELVPHIAYLADPDDLRVLQKAAQFCLHRDRRMLAHAKLKVFEEHQEGEDRNNRLWRRASAATGLTSLALACTRADGNRCPRAPCKGVDLSLCGAYSQNCEENEGTTLKEVQLTASRAAKRETFVIPKAVIQRRRKNEEGREDPGAGIRFIDLEGVGDSLASFVAQY